MKEVGTGKIVHAVLQDRNRFALSLCEPLCIIPVARFTPAKDRSADRPDDLAPFCYEHNQGFSMSGKLIAQRIEPRRSTRLIQRKDGTTVIWIFLAGRQCKQTVSAVEPGKIEETIQKFGLEPAAPMPVHWNRERNDQKDEVI
jgi:hypothetical protein